MRVGFSSRAAWRTAWAVALAAAATVPVAARPKPEPLPDLDVVRPVLVESLDAAGISDASARDAAIARFDVLAARLANKIGTHGSAEHRARRLHTLLHRWTFRLYREDADALPEVLDRGDYNCVSASLLEGMLARSLGLDAWVAAGPRHVFLRIELPRGRSIDVETTAPDGFDARRGTRKAGRILLAYKLATTDEIAARGAAAVVESYQGIRAPIPLEDAPAFVWHNSGKRALERGDAVTAARAFDEAATRHPGVAMAIEGSELAIARAFRIAYDEARFGDAYAIALMGVKLTPQHVSARDRLIAAAIQRIEAASKAGDIAAAEAILDDVRGILFLSTDGFERGAIPGIVAAAIRVGDWTRAERLAARYAAVEPDPVEGVRMARWVASRKAALRPLP